MAVGTANQPGSNLSPQGQPSDTPPTPFIPSAPANVVTFSTSKITPPSPLYFQRDDKLAFVAMSARNNETVTFSGRFLGNDGQIRSFSRQLKLPNLLTEGTDTLDLQEGWLLGISINANIATTWGQTYARCLVVRGNPTFNALTNNVQVLAGGYTYANALLGWPGQSPADSVSGEWGPLSGQLSTPSVGTDIFQVVTHTRWRPVLLIATLVTSSAVASRQVNFAWGPTAGQLGGPGAPAAQTATTTVQYGFAKGVSQYTDARGIVWIPIPQDLYLSAGYDPLGAMGWGTSTANLQSGDQWTVNKALQLQLLEAV